MYPSYSLNQQTYILKEEINKLRYHKMKNSNVNTSRISEIYQTILSQRAESWVSVAGNLKEFTLSF